MTYENNSVLVVMVSIKVVSTEVGYTFFNIIKHKTFAINITLYLHGSLECLENLPMGIPKTFPMEADQIECR